MKNFEFEDEGKKSWYSRSVAVLGMILGCKDEKLYVLATKRGKDTPNYQGFWCMPCGYLDYDETTEQAVIREIYEETGIKIGLDLVKLHSIDSIPDDIKQNVTIRYLIKTLPIDSYPSLIKPDVGEVEEVNWISINDIENYNWAFGHLNLIKNFLINE